MTVVMYTVYNLNGYQALHFFAVLLHEARGQNVAFSEFKIFHHIASKDDRQFFTLIFK